MKARRAHLLLSLDLAALLLLACGLLRPASAEEESAPPSIVAAARATLDSASYGRLIESLTARADCRDEGGPYVLEIDALYPDHLAWRRIDGRGVREVVIAGDLAWSIDANTGFARIATHDEVALARRFDAAACRFVRVEATDVRPALFLPPGELGIAPPDPTAGFDCTEIEQIPAAECHALLALYTATAGERWRFDPAETPWLASQRPCDWTGVACELVANGASSRIIGLDLWGRNLRGELSTELAWLRRLRRLRLGSNDLSGPIPAALGGLLELTTLDLGSNRLRGAIPAELGRLTVLVTLNLAHNQLSGPIPPSLAELPRLRELGLYQNRLSGSIPPALVASPSLETLSLWENELRGTLPVDLGPRLRSFSFWNNSLHGTIPEVYRRFRLEGNYLSITHLCIPPSLDHVIVNRRYLEPRRQPCFQTAAEVAAWERKQKGPSPRWVMLDEPAELLVRPLAYSLRGPLLDVRGDAAWMGQPQIVDGGVGWRTEDGIFLADALQVASSDAILPPRALRDVSRSEARQSFDRTLEELTVFGVIEDERRGAYAATLGADGRIADYSLHGPGFTFIFELTFPAGRILHLYQDGRYVGQARVTDSQGADQEGGAWLEVGEIEALAPYSRARPLLFSLRPLVPAAALETPDFGTLLGRPKDTDGFESFSDYVFVGRLDLDRDGVAELLFRRLGLESRSFEIFRHLEGRWQSIYRGGAHAF